MRGGECFRDVHCSFVALPEADPLLSTTSNNAHNVINASNANST